MTPEEIRQASTSQLRARLVEVDVFLAQIGPVDLALVDERAEIVTELQRRKRSLTLLVAGGVLVGTVLMFGRK